MTADPFGAFAVVVAVAVALGTAGYSLTKGVRLGGRRLARLNGILALGVAIQIALDSVEVVWKYEHSVIDYIGYTVTLGLATSLLGTALVYRGWLRKIKGWVLWMMGLPTALLFGLAILPNRAKIFEDPNGDLKNWVTLLMTGCFFAWLASGGVFASTIRLKAFAWRTWLPAITALVFFVASLWTIVGDASPIGSYVITAPLVPLAVMVSLGGRAAHVTPPALRVLIEGLPDAVVALDETGRPAYLNARARRLAGVEDSGDREAVGRSMVPGWAELPVGATVFAEGAVLSLRRVTIPDHGTVIVLRDVTEAYAWAERAEAAADAQGDYFAAVSHELRTPLGGILGLAGLLRSSPLDDEQRAWAASIEDCAKRLGALVTDVLDLAKLDADRFTLLPAVVDIAAILRDAAEIHSVAAAAKNVRVRAVGTDRPRWVVADGLRVRQIADNLLSNAVKFTPEGEIVLTLSGSEEGIRFSVADRGPGIAPDKKETIFERFRQADAAVAGRYGGTGLGLPIARRLARQMDGDVTVEDAAEGGSVFRVRLGLLACDPPAAAAPVAAPDDLHGVRILLVEDDPVLAIVGRTTLERAGASVELATDGLMAVERCLTERFDAILMDMQMPGLTGPEAARKIRANGYRGPIAALTANARAEDRDLCRAAGMDIHLTKPISREALITEIGRLVTPTGPTGLPSGC